MEKNQSNELNSDIKIFPKYLWFLILSYTMMLSISNWFDTRLISIFGHAVSPGAIIFPLTFLISDIITEVYGYKNARVAIWSAFFFNIIFVMFGQIIIHLPSPDFATNNIEFDKLLHVNAYIIIGSFLSYLIAEPLNSLIVSKLKVLFKGEYMGIRFVASTIFSSGIDSFIFATAAFFSFYSFYHVFYLALNIWVIKISIEILGLRISINVAKFIKRKEKIDIYDKDTNYNIFKLDTIYKIKDNLFKT